MATKSLLIGNSNTNIELDSSTNFMVNRYFELLVLDVCLQLPNNFVRHFIYLLLSRMSIHCRLEYKKKFLLNFVLHKSTKALMS